MAFEDEKDPYCTSDKFATKNGMKVVELGEDSATATMTIDESFLNGIGIPMGGAISRWATTRSARRATTLRTRL